MILSSGASPGNLATNHADLNRLWAQKETKRSDGGWWSLSGFSIQATIGFERFVRRLLIDREPRLIGFEAVSDLTEVDKKVRLTQVKRTLTKDSLASAILEACKIVALCTPAFAKTLEFQVVCERDDARIAPKDVSLKSIFKDAKPDLASHQRVIEQFNHAEPIKVMSSPGLSLRRTLLSAGVRNPDRVARDALGTLFDAFDGQNRDGVERALYQAIDQIESQARPDDAIPGRLLTPEKFARQPSGKAGLFTSSRPRLTDLVGNRFLERPRLLETVFGAAEAWLAGLEESYERDDLQLPILWLEGRSGDGKSVLTLQLLEALVATQARLASVTELDSAEELSSWLRSASLWDGASQNQAEIGFVDDLAARAEQAEIDPLIEGAFYRGSTYVGLITCGTPEGRKAFSKGRHVVVTSVTVPPPTAADYEAFRQWAEQRLGRALSERDPADSSVSQFMMRLSLDSHAPRTVRYHAPPALRAALAVNALGLPASKSLATEELVTDFVQAWGDLDLSPVEDRDGVRIAHAEAVWPLYIEAVGDADLAEAWGSDLGRVLSAHLASGETTEARTLLGSLMNRRTHIERLRRAGSQREDSAVMDAVFRTVSEACPADRRASLFRLWLPARVAGRLTAIDITALREEGRSLVANQNIDQEIRSEIAATLLLVGRERDDAHRAAAAYLNHAAPGYAAGKFTVTALPGRYGADLTAVAISWLASNKDAVEIGPILAQVIGKAPSRELEAIALGYVKKHMANPASGPVLRSLSGSSRSKAFQAIQDDWLKTCADPGSAVAIYRELFQSRDWRRYVPGALKLIHAHPNERGEQDILSILVRRRWHDPAVIGATRAWLDSRAYEASATPVLLEILSAPDLAVQDLQRALRHIDTNAPGHRAVFGTLSVVLKTLSHEARSKLRAQLPLELAYTFDHAVMWKIKPIGRLKRLDERLRAKKSDQPT